MNVVIGCYCEGFRLTTVKLSYSVYSEPSWSAYMPEIYKDEAARGKKHICPEGAMAFEYHRPCVKA